MFKFADPNPPVLESNITWGEAEEKYPDKFMIVINMHIDNTELHGDIIAILTPMEYSELDFPEPMAPKYDVWKGLDIKRGGFGIHGLYM